MLRNAYLRHIIMSQKMRQRFLFDAFVTYFWETAEWRATKLDPAHLPVKILCLGQGTYEMIAEEHHQKDYNILDDTTFMPTQIIYIVESLRSQITLTTRCELSTKYPTNIQMKSMNPFEKSLLLTQICNRS